MLQPFVVVTICERTDHERKQKAPKTAAQKQLPGTQLRARPHSTLESRRSVLPSTGDLPTAHKKEYNDAKERTADLAKDGALLLVTPRRWHMAVGSPAARATRKAWLGGTQADGV